MKSHDVCRCSGTLSTALRNLVRSETTPNSLPGLTDLNGPRSRKLPLVSASTLTAPSPAAAAIQPSPDDAAASAAEAAADGPLHALAPVALAPPEPEPPVDTEEIDEVPWPPPPAAMAAAATAELAVAAEADDLAAKTLPLRGSTQRFSMACGATTEWRTGRVASNRLSRTRRLLAGDSFAITSLEDKGKEEEEEGTRG